MNDRAESVDRSAHPLFQAGGGGSTPTSALALTIEECSYETAERLNVEWHSVLPRCDKGSMWRGFRAAFCAVFDGRIFAVAIWSSPMTQAVDDGSTAELRRFAIAPDAPRYTGSRMLAIMVRMMRRKYPTLRRAISYQAVDAHAGTIYKAAGWTAGRTTAFSAWGQRKRRAPRSDRQRDAAVGGYVNTPSNRRPAQIESDKVRWELAL